MSAARRVPGTVVVSIIGLSAWARAADDGDSCMGVCGNAEAGRRAGLREVVQFEDCTGA